MKLLKFPDAAAAEAAGYHPVTIGYQLPQEQRLLHNVLADMRRGKINHCLVQLNTGIAVWRSSRAGAACTNSGCAAGQVSRTGTNKKPVATKCKSLLTSAATTKGRTGIKRTARRSTQKRTARRSFPISQKRTAKLTVPTQTKNGRRSAASLPKKGKRL